MKFLVVIFGYFLFISEIYSYFPPDIPRCKAGDNDCIVSTINELIPKLKNGRADMNLVPIDPLDLKILNIDMGSDSPVAINLTLKDVDVYGLSETTVSKAHGFVRDPKGTTFEIDAFVPQMRLIGRYKVKGKVMVLPVTGQGKHNLTLDSMKIHIRFTTAAIQRDEHIHIQTDKFKLTFNTTRLHMRFSNLFNGDRMLSSNMNHFLNANWETILTELKPSIQNTFSHLIADLINSVFDRLAYTEIFADDGKRR